MTNELKESSPLDRMIQEQVVEKGIRDERVVSALRAVPRERFFPAAEKHDAYADRPAPIGYGQMISQPYIVALMTQKLDLQKSHRVLEIGTGSGYQTAILAKLAREVYTIERLKPLLDSAFERLLSMNLRNVHFKFGDGTLGWATEAPFDRILITAGAPQVPQGLLLSQLADGGLAILPVGPHDEQLLLEIRRQGNELIQSEICPCRFVKLIGQEGWAGK